MWFGTFGAGVSILDPQANKFTLFKNNPFNPNSLASSFVWTIFEAAWTVPSGLEPMPMGSVVMTSDNGTFTHYDHNPLDPSSLVKFFGTKDLSG